MVITDALIRQMAKWPLKDQKQVMDENPRANYALMISKCDEIAAQFDIDGKFDKAQQVEDLKFVASVYLIRQKRGGDSACIV